MVDVRPLLFINALAFMLLLTAGFAKVTTHKSHSGAEIPPLYPEISSSTPQPPVDSSVIVESGSREAAIDSAEDVSIVETTHTDEQIFADTPNPISDEVEVTHNPEPEVAEVNTAQPVEQRPEPVEQVAQEVADSADVPPKPETSKTLSQPIAEEIALEQVTIVKPKPIEAIKATTGQLVVRSNVSDDMVLVNGRPYGKTKLDLTLKPGNYQIEVAKSGYVSWKGSAQVVAGQTSSLQARLEEYTSVEYKNGVWRGGIVTGEGVFIDSDRTEYTGSFVNKLFHGKGSIRYPDGTKYTGDWFEGKMQGRGSLTLANGDTYIGEFREDQFNGDGTLTKTNGDIYSGFWVNGALNGQGSLTTKSGMLYVGGFSDNLFHGEGNLTYPDSRHYEGGFSNGKYHGKGAETFPNGKKYSGQFMDGQYHGQGEIQNPNGSKITGTFKFGKPFGKATLTTPEGEIFTARTTEPGVCYRDKSYRATTCPPMEGW